MVVLLADSVLGGKPQVLLPVERIVETGAGKGGNAAVEIVHSLNDAVRLGKIVNQAGFHRAVGLGDAKLRFAALFHDHFGVFIHIAVSVTGNADRLFPCRDIRGDALDQNRRAEHCTVENGTDGAVGGLPHLFEIVLGHSRGVGGDGGALDRHAVLLGCLRAFDGDFVIRLVAVYQAQIIVFGL